MSARSCCGTMKVRGFWVWGPKPGEEQGVGSFRRMRFSWAGEEEWGRAAHALCVSAQCIHRGADKGTVFLSVFDLSGHLSPSLLLCICLPVLRTLPAGSGDMQL